MKDLELRLRLLEGRNQLGACLECECQRLNAQARGESGPVNPCSHKPGLTLLDALRGLVSTEQEHAIG